MKIGILKSDGTPISIDSFSGTIRYDINGFITSFTAGFIYRYYQNAEFRAADRYRDNLDGYYREDKYVDYIQNFTVSDNSTSIVELLSTYKFNFMAIKAKVGDAVTVKSVDYGLPYETFYNQKEYTFNLEATADNQGVKSYKKGVYEKLVLVDYVIDVPATATATTINNDLSNTPTWYFYQKNFGDNVNGWTISDSEKEKFKRLATLIAFRINYLIIDVFPHLLNPTDTSIVDGVANSTSLDISDMPVILQTVFLLKKSWGYYYSPNADPALVHRTSFDPIFSSTPNDDEYSYYYAGLVTLYNRCYKIPDRLTNLPDNTKLSYLLRVLPITALSIFPFSVITNALIALAKTRILSQNDEDLIVKLVTSIGPPNVDTFLDFLLAKDIDVEKTNFESIYKVLSDARLERIPFVNWFVSEQTNRKYFNFVVYQLWTQSKYNFQYFPPGTPDPHPRTNPDAYFNQNPDEFNINGTLTFSTLDTGTNTDTPITTVTRFTSKINEAKIDISIVNDVSRYMFTNTGDDSFSQVTKSDEKLLGSFHFYQPIALIGFKASLDLGIPNQSVMPAFLFYYAQEYTQLADFDVAVALTIDLTTDALLLYFNGGTSLLADLQYLMDVTQIGKGLLGELPELTDVLIWRGLAQETASFSITAVALTHIQDYLIATADNDHDKELLQKSRKLILTLAAISGGFSLVASTYAAGLAKDIEALFEGATLLVPEEFENLISTVSGELGTAISSFETKLVDLFPSGENNIITKYSALTSEQQQAFWQTFKDIDDNTWRLLNQSTGYAVDNWLALYQNNIGEASIVDFIVNQDRVDRIIKFYSSSSIRGILEEYSYAQRVGFLDSSFGEIEATSIIFSNLENTPLGIELAMNAVFETRVGKDVFEIEDVQKVLTVGLDAPFIGTLVERNKLANWIETTNNYTQNIDVEIISIPDLGQLYNNYIDEISDSKALKDFLRSNRLFTTTQAYNDDIPVGGLIRENFISGKNEIVNSILDKASTSMKEDFVEFYSDKFENFKLKAFDNNNPPRDRSFDTEMKYVFNFLENHYSLGNRFVITMESTLYTCPNCQRYLQALQNFAETDGKIIEIKFMTRFEASGMTDVKLLIQQ